MEEEENGENSSPFWVQSSRNRHRGRRLRQGFSSFFFSSGLLVSILLLTAVLFLIFVVPSTISLSSQIFRPNNVKKSWDSLNFVLVLFALVFGFLSRNRNEDRNFDEDFYQTASTNTARNETQNSNPSTPQGWYSYSSADQKAKNSSNGGLRKTATSNSYPDLLYASSKLTTSTDPWLSYDDMRINTSDGQLHRGRNWKYTFEDPQPESKDFYEDTFVVSPQQPSSFTPAPPSPPPAAAAPPSPPPPAPAAPPSPPPPPASLPLDEEQPMRAYESVGHKRERRRKRKDNQLKQTEPVSEPAATLPTPPPLPPLPEYVDQKNGKSEKKRSGGNATKDFLNSLYHKKKKKQRQKSVENFDALLHKPQIPPLQYQVPPESRHTPPPPPPPPPPPSVFQNLFSTKKSKRKTTATTVISVPIPPPKAFPRPKASQIVAPATRKPRKPVKVRSFDTDSEEGNSYIGRESPLIPIPPSPPPPPPFLKSPAWKFVLQGDYVRLDSFSSRSGSPETDDEVESNGTPTASDGGETTPFPASPLFFPSPDVNTKADNFINRFRAGLKLEKVNSMNKRGVGLSKLGPTSGPSRS